MRSFNIDYSLFNKPSKGTVTKQILAYLFAEFHNYIERNDTLGNFDKKRDLLEEFQRTYEACDFIKSHDLSKSRRADYYNAIEEISACSTAIQIPKNIKELFRQYCSFFRDSSYQIKFGFDVPEIKRDAFNEYFDYLKRSILKECEFVEVTDFSITINCNNQDNNY